MTILQQPRRNHNHNQSYNCNNDHFSHNHSYDHDHEHGHIHSFPHRLNISTVKKFVSKLKKAVVVSSNISSRSSSGRISEDQTSVARSVSSDGHIVNNILHGWIPRLISSCSDPSYSSSCEAMIKQADNMYRASESCRTSHHSYIAPQGFVSVYAGRERKRFIIPASYLNHPAFRLLLEKSKEEFGFSQKGALNLPFELNPFERLLWLIGHGDPPSNDLSVQELEQYYRERYHLSINILHDMDAN